MKGRIILQELASPQYLTPGGGWATSCQEARTFEHTYLLEGLKHRKAPTQVVWCFRNPSANFYVPVNPCDADKIYPCVMCPLSGARTASESAPSFDRISVATVSDETPGDQNEL